MRGRKSARFVRERIMHGAPCLCPTSGGSGKCWKMFLRTSSACAMCAKMSCRACERSFRPHANIADRKRTARACAARHVLVVKYCDHLPSHRQSDICAREASSTARSWRAGAYMAALSEPRPSASRALCAAAPRSTVMDGSPR